MCVSTIDRMVLRADKDACNHVRGDIDTSRPCTKKSTNKTGLTRFEEDAFEVDASHGWPQILAMCEGEAVRVLCRCGSRHGSEVGADVDGVAGDVPRDARASRAIISIHLFAVSELMGGFFDFLCGCS